MKKLVIVGCGRLAGIVAEAVIHGLLSEYDLKSHVYEPTTGEVFHIDLADTWVGSLTPREKEVLLLICDGLLSKEISARLRMSVYTVSVHRRHIFNKLGCDNAMEAVKRASTLGLLP